VRKQVLTRKRSILYVAGGLLGLRAEAEMHPGSSAALCDRHFYEDALERMNARRRGPIRASCGGGDALPSTHFGTIKTNDSRRALPHQRVSIESKPKPPSAYSPTTSCEQSIWLAHRGLRAGLA